MKIVILVVSILIAIFSGDPNFKVFGVVGGLITLLYDFYCSEANSSYLRSNINQLTLRLNGLKKAFFKHKAQPHIVATAEIEPNHHPPRIVNSTGKLVGVIGYSNTKIGVLLDVPPSLNNTLIPKVDSTGYESPSVKVAYQKGPTIIEIEWPSRVHGKMPDIVYITITATSPS